MINELKDRVETQLVHAHYEAGAAIKAEASEADLKPIQDDIRHAQWRWDHVTASHGIAMHNPEEALRVLGAAIDLSADARVKLTRLLSNIGLDMDKLEAEKPTFQKLFCATGIMKLKKESQSLISKR